MSRNEVVPATAFAAMKTDIEVSMDDVVSAFVSQYENNLYARKKDLTHDIRLFEESLADLNKSVHKKVTGAEFKKTKLPFGLKIKVDDGTIRWEDGQVTFGITILKDESRYGNTITLSKKKAIPAADIKAWKSIIADLEELRSELSEVLVSLKSVNRKERQVRGRIAMRKLEDSGYASLMQDEELLQLVQLED